MTKNGSLKPNPTRPELEIHLGNQTRTLRFNGAQVAALEAALDMDPLAFIGQQKGLNTFCMAAVIAGLSWDKAKRKELTPDTVHSWFDAETELDKEDFAKEVLYAIGRGKTGEEGKRYVRVLEEVFGVAPVEGAGPGPTSGG